jgi:HK97 family phage major capsid protein
MENKTVEELLERRTAIASEIEVDGADLDALEAEARSINDELERRKAVEHEKAELREKVADGEGEKIKDFIKENHTMTNEEIRASHEYNVAYANYIKTGKADECRALLTELVGGTVPVATYVADRISTAWNKLGIMALVKKTYVKGILKVGFEKSATAATVHTESTTAVAEETLEIGAVSLSPVSIKKFISISDEALDLSGEAFLDYVVDELTYQIAKKAQALLISKITALSTTIATNAVSVGKIAANPAMGTVAQALGTLSDDAANPVLVMNKGTWAQFKAAQYANGFAADPFEGCQVYFDNSLPVAATTTTDVYMVVGDFAVGAQANFPNGEEITIKRDDLSLVEKDLVKFVGRQYVGMGVIADKAFCLVGGVVE